MNAIVRPRQYGPTLPPKAGDRELDTLARNRQGTTPSVKLTDDVDPLDTSAFRLAGLRRRRDQCRVALTAAKAVMAAARGKAATKDARRRLKVAEMAMTRAETRLRDEIRGETLAPAVQRDEIAHEVLGWEGEGWKTRVRTRSTVVLREPRVDVGKRVELVSPLDRLLKRESITLEQHRAGKAYRDAWETSGMDAYPVGLGEGIGGMPGSGNRRIEDAVGAGAALSAMRARLSLQGVNLVEHVVVHELDVAAWAARRTEAHGKSMRPDRAMGLLVAYLDVLGIV